MKKKSLLRPTTWSISAKLTVTLLLTALTPMLLTSYYNLQGSLASVSSTELRNLKQFSTATANRIDQLISDMRFLTRYLGTEQDIISLINAPQKNTGALVQGKLQRLLTADEKIELLFVLDSEGKVLSSPAEKFIGRNYAYRDYFQAAIQGRLYVSNIIVGDVTRKPGLFFSGPVTGKSGKVEGVVVVKISGSAVASIIEEANSETRTAFLVDSDGVLIYHPDRALMYSSLMPLSSKSLDKIISSKRFMRDTINSLDMSELHEAIVGARHSGTVSYFSSLSKENEVAGYAPVSSHGWVVAVNTTYASFASPLNKLFQNVLYSVVIVGIVFAIIALIFARTFTSPVRKLMFAADKVKQGDYDHAEVKITSSDEIGQLMRTFNQMVAGVRERERERDIFGRVVSPEVREKLLKGDIQLGGENRRVSVLFSDIRSFSTMSEKMSASDTVEFLNEYLSEMTAAVQEHGGYVNNFIGDAIVVIFGAPDAQEDMEYRAVAAACEMRRRLEVINLRRMQNGQDAVESGIGISTGKVVAGQVGSLERFLYTVIGDSVNVAARLETLTKEFPEYHILINGDTYSGVIDRDEFDFVNLGQQTVKGRSSAVTVYAVKEAEESQTQGEVRHAGEG